MGFSNDIQGQVSDLSPFEPEKPTIKVVIQDNIEYDKIEGADGDDEITDRKNDDELNGGRGDYGVGDDEGNDIINGQYGDDELEGDQ